MKSGKATFDKSRIAGASVKGTLGLAVAMACAVMEESHAGNFTTENGLDVHWSLSSSVGTSRRARDAASDLIAVGNGGTAGTGNDNGDLNFGKGQPFSTSVNLLGDIDVSRDGVGVFMRAKAWHDFTLSGGGVAHGSFANGYTPGAKLDDSGFDRLAKFSGVALLDAYAYGTFDVTPDHPMTVRVGNQVINWGESLFVPGINQFGAFDVTAAHRPGAQVKEILLPVPQIMASLNISEGTSVEAFYELARKKTVIDGCGTFWSPSSIADCSSSGTIVGSGPFSDQQMYSGIQALGGANFRMTLAPEAHPSGAGQFGVALRQRLDSLDTNFGFYYARYDTRVPNISAVLNPTVVPGSVWAANPPFGQKASQIMLDYSADKIKVAGVSASTVIAGWSVFGEVSHTSDLPVQINGSDLINGIVAGIGPMAKYSSSPLGTVVHGYDRKSKTQVQVSTIQILPRILGAEAVTVVGEIAAQRWSGIGDPATSIRYGRAFVFGAGPVAGIPCAALNPNVSYCENAGFATSSAWGIRAQIEASYPDAFAGANVKPRLFVSQDVKGYSADGFFSEDRRQISPGLRIDYRGKYYADISYARFNHSAKYDETRDRDFYTLVVGVNF